MIKAIQELFIKSKILTPKYIGFYLKAYKYKNITKKIKKIKLSSSYKTN